MRLFVAAFLGAFSGLVAAIGAIYAWRHARGYFERTQAFARDLKAIRELDES